MRWITQTIPKGHTALPVACLFLRDKYAKPANSNPMTPEEAISHLERAVSRLEDHIRKQDAEMYSMSKQLDALKKDLKRLDARVEGSGDGATPGPDRDPEAEKPPHY
ncbi:SlyX family protein [Puniceicoccales bacterium CK1056]|uniref:SlyX family protein n=1 Tax=Oceanipulchritudo coccoides TaxID=2706888 RepID=A0A6B2M477_9BACT|nr:SlyX family protein [Oceanipulchritudo coccoides]NDV63563.1 SlyX family protein [Oceanipulchritudo coccoides]